MSLGERLPITTPRKNTSIKEIIGRWNEYRIEIRTTEISQLFFFHYSTVDGFNLFFKINTLQGHMIPWEFFDDRTYAFNIIKRSMSYWTVACFFPEAMYCNADL